MKLLLLFVITVRPLGADTRDTESIYSLTIDRRIRCGTCARTATLVRIRLPRTGRSTPNTRVRLLSVTQNLPVRAGIIGNAAVAKPIFPYFGTGTSAAISDWPMLTPGTLAIPA